MLEIIQYVHVWCCLFVEFGKNRMKSSFCTIWLGVTALGFPQPENVRSTFGNRSPILLNPPEILQHIFCHRRIHIFASHISGTTVTVKGNNKSEDTRFKIFTQKCSSLAFIRIDTASKCSVEPGAVGLDKGWTFAKLRKFNPFTRERLPWRLTLLSLNPM